MKKLLWILVIILAILILILGGAWVFREKIASFYFSKALGVPVSIEKITYERQVLIISDIKIGNPKGSKTDTAFQAEEIATYLPIANLREPTIDIPWIEMKNIQLNIEFYNPTETDSNWSRIMKTDKTEKKEKKSSKDFYIERLTMKKLTVSTISSSGTQKTFPTIERLDIYDISEETGFPVEEIEKAIFYEVLKDVIRRFNLPGLLKSLNPNEWIPGFLPQIPLFPNKGGGSAPPSQD